MAERWCVNGSGEVQQKAVYRSAENFRGELACRNDGQGARKLRIVLAESP